MDTSPNQDPYLARFESRIQDKLNTLPAEVAKPVEYFATWHHLRRIRFLSTPKLPGAGALSQARDHRNHQVPGMGSPKTNASAGCGNYAQAHQRILLLLYAQPLARVAKLRTDKVKKPA